MLSRRFGSLFGRMAERLFFEGREQLCRLAIVLGCSDKVFLGLGVPCLVGERFRLCEEVRYPNMSVGLPRGGQCRGKLSAGCDGSASCLLYECRRPRLRKDGGRVLGTVARLLEVFLSQQPFRVIEGEHCLLMQFPGI